MDATSACRRFGSDPARTLCIDLLLDLQRHRCLMQNPATAPAMRDAAHALLAADGVGVTLINDSVGFVAQRVLALIVNLAGDIVQQRIASVDRPIHANTLKKAARATSGKAFSGKARRWPARSASRARITAAHRPDTPRANSGGQSRSRTFIAGQLRPQPREVTASSSRPVVRAANRGTPAL